MSSREKVQADFDLERFIGMFDEALTSKDERVINALRSLIMMVVLTKPEGRDQAGDGDKGPLRQLFDDQHNILRRLERLEHDINSIAWRDRDRYEYEKMRNVNWDPSKYSLAVAQMAQTVDADIHRHLGGTTVGQVPKGLNKI